jgi:pyruvate formate-lyase activating enzyme-like uncharacterized protein
MGSGFTGGDPLVKPTRTIEYIKYLKNEFGADHQIHLYTVPDYDHALLQKLAEAGLDEIRFHLPVSTWSGKSGKHLNRIEAAFKTEPIMDVGVELPALPDKFEELKTAAETLNDLGCAFLNLNELEFSETNWKELRKHGFDVKNDISAGVAGSEEVAVKLVEHADERSFDMGVHYCSASFKDAIQLRKRILRRAKNTRRPLDVVTDEGMFIRGVIETHEPDILIKELKQKFKISPKLIEHDHAKSRIQVAAWILDEIAGEIEEDCYIVEEYPTADRLEVEREKIN